MNLKFLALHTPLNFAGKNFSDKIDFTHSRNQDLRAWYDEKDGWVKIVRNGQTGLIPMTNVALMVEDDGVKSASPVAVRAISGKVKAQASTPAGIKND